ncbi:hypothetical protein BASA81_004929 [Batrachochytrium salamandrivorans]|nr:hypothetical protein BASA81_004929 [Batrachochytrium salamandrivorans]
MSQQEAKQQLVGMGNGDTYLGELMDGVPNGLGVYTSKLSGDVVEAEFVLGRIHGQGSLQRSNGDFFAGRFESDRMVSGTYLYANGGGVAVRYRGTFKDNIPHGTGALEFTNGDAYEGEFWMGAATGTGRYVSAAGDITAGVFSKGRPVKGTRVFAKTGHRFVGEFGSTGGEFTGQGKLEFANGDGYVGHFVQGKFHGQGRYSFGNEALVVSCATWQHDQPVGNVQVEWPAHSAVFYGELFDSSRRKLVGGKGVVRFGDGSWLESSRFTGRVGDLPSDLQGGAFYQAKHRESKSWCSLAGAGNLNRDAVWLGVENGLRFSAANQTNCQGGGGGGGDELGVLLSCHQRLLCETAQLSHFVWVRTESKGDGNDGEELLTSMTKAVMVQQCSAGLCLLLSSSEGGSRMVVNKVANNLSVLALHHHHHNNGLLALIDCQGNEVTDLTKALMGNAVVMFTIQTGFTNKPVMELIKDLQTRRTKLLIVWTGGNPQQVHQTAQDLAHIAQLL